FVFFFSSRRRHTRSKRDWSSDVCSSDLIESLFSYLEVEVDYKRVKHPDLHPGRSAMISLDGSTIGFIGQVHPLVEKQFDLKETRSEERRVGKESRYRNSSSQ